MRDLGALRFKIIECLPYRCAVTMGGTGGALMEKARKTRGVSPRGVFEETKSAALEAIAAQKAAQRLKTEKLRALREQREKIDAGKSAS